MKLNKDEKQRFISAKNKVKKIKLFYIHFVGYLIFVGLILCNFYIIEDGQYKTIIISLNLSILGAWTVFILIHGLSVFKGKQIFKKRWEDKKIKKFLKDQEDTDTTLWE